MTRSDGNRDSMHYPAPATALRCILERDQDRLCLAYKLQLYYRYAAKMISRGEGETGRLGRSWRGKWSWQIIPDYLYGNLELWVTSTRVRALASSLGVLSLVQEEERKGKTRKFASFLI